MDNKVQVLLLDDREEDFKKMKEIIEDILQKDCEMCANFIFDFEQNALITKYEDGNGYYHLSIRSGRKEMREKYHFQIEKMLSEIRNYNNVIAIIDINWDTIDNTNRHGRTFYDAHLKKIAPNNTIFVSIIEAKDLGRDLTSGFKFVAKKNKNEEGDIDDIGNLFKEKMKNAINCTKILTEGLMPDSHTTSGLF